jgi:hydrogenase nickel incorporation protein HypA/HybF
MHELAIAQRLIDTAVALLPADASQVAKLRIELGALAGVSKDELEFGFEAMSKETPCANAILEIAEIPAVAHCPQCGIDFSVADTDQLFCPTCGTSGVLVVQGKELILASIEAQVEETNQEQSQTKGETFYG